MDLLVKTILAAVVVFALLFVVYYLVGHVLSGPITSSQAVSLVESDLSRSYPSAVINITNVTQSQYPGSWHIVASVITNATSPCPTYSVLSFDYPKYGFVSRLENNYTSGCVVYGLVGNSSYILASYPVAIARSYSLKIPQVMDYVKSVGYANTIVTATYYPTFYHIGKDYSKIWLVNYSSPRSNQAVYVILTQESGNFVTEYNSTA